MKDGATPVNRLLALLLLMVAVLSGGLLARAVWLFLEPEHTVSVSVDWSTETATDTASTAGPDQYARQIAEGMWFGSPAAEPEPEPDPAPVVVAPETQLEFRLRGVMAGSDPARGSALISRASGNSEYFRVGDTIFGQAELVEVYGDRVVMSRGGELETLSFEENLPQGTAGQAGNAAGSGVGQQASAGQSARVGGSAVSPPPGGGSPSSGGQTATPPPAERSAAGSAQQRLEEDLRMAIQELQSRAQSDPEGLMRQYGLEQTDRGYRVTPRAGILIANGLRPGDRITEINDQPVGNIERDQALVNSVLQSDQIKITLERSGATYRFYQSLPNF